MDHARPHTVIAGTGRLHDESFLSLIGSAGYAPVSLVSSGPEAIEQICIHQPELVITDLVLPGTDGIGLARHVLNMPLDRYPAILIFDPAGCMPGGHEALMKCGVSVLTGIPAESELISAIEDLRPEKRALPSEKCTRLEGLMDDLGIPDHPGRAYLRSASALVWMDSRYLNSLKRQLYTQVARIHSTDAARVERAMRYAIDTAWRTGLITHQHRIFGDTIDARRGKPTCGEMIARLADILRWEGRE